MLGDHGRDDESLYDRDDGRDAGESLSDCNLTAIWTCGAASVVASVAALSWAVEAGAAAGGGHDYTKVAPELSLLNCGPSADLPSASLMCLVWYRTFKGKQAAAHSHLARLPRSERARAHRL